MPSCGTAEGQDGVSSHQEPVRLSTALLWACLTGSLHCDFRQLSEGQLLKAGVCLEGGMVELGHSHLELGVADGIRVEYLPVNILPGGGRAD